MGILASLDPDRSCQMQFNMTTKSDIDAIVNPLDVGTFASLINSPHSCSNGIRLLKKAKMKASVGSKYCAFSKAPSIGIHNRRHGVATPNVMRRRRCDG